MKIDFHNLQFVECFIAEKSLIERLCISKKDNKINFQLFSNLLYSPIDRDDFIQYRGFYITINVLREKMGFKKDEKPGDFDVLIIPHSDGNMFFERTCAIEVKVVRPTRQKPKKSPNSNGITQIQGLIKDGFPLIGLIHICMPEPLLDIEKHTIKLYTTPIDIDNPKNNRSFSDESVDMYLDSFSQFSSENQMKKLISKDIPKYVGLCTLGVNMSSNGDLITWADNDFNAKYGAGYFNPHLKTETIQRIKSFWENHQELFKYAEI